MTLGERLKQARLARNLSLTALARASGLSKGFLSQVESGATNPSLGSLRRLAEALSLTVSDLVGTGELPPRADVTLRPRLVRRVHPERNKSSLLQIGTSSQGAVYVAHLLPGTALESLVPSGPADAYLMVLAGEVEFDQSGTRLRLAEGDSLSFSLSPTYRVTAHTRFRASLLLMLQSAADLPGILETPFREMATASQEAPVTPTDFQGPLRLVAMRAARTAERGR
ncbi:MAG: XRE family transcriptional regulator [Chloroflexota bacterium]|nr:XRE family transcriptional regulator [Chloroflexota bacterium]MDQ5864135.1 XRE family transcriptional regulator [Chloroflexota bacterium]